MERANQFMSALKVVMGNMASFLKDHEVMPTEAGAISNLCAAAEEKSTGGNSHSSKEEGKVYRDSGFESEFEAREREKERPGSNQFPEHNLLPSPVPKSLSSGSSQHISKRSKNEALNSCSSKCSSFESDFIEFDKELKIEEKFIEFDKELKKKSKELNDREFEGEEGILEEHEELVDVEIKPRCENSNVKMFDQIEDGILQEHEELVDVEIKPRHKNSNVEMFDQSEGREGILEEHEELVDVEIKPHCKNSNVEMFNQSEGGEGILEEHEELVDVEFKPHCKNSDFKMFDEGEKDGILEEHEELVDVEIKPRRKNSDEIEAVFNSISSTVKNIDDSILQKNKSESSQDRDILQTDGTVHYSSSQSGMEQTPSARSNSSSNSASSESTKSKSNYYRPISPVSPDVSIISSALHSKPHPPSSSSLSNLSATIISSLHRKSTSETDSSQSNVSPTVSSSHERIPSPTVSSSASHSKSSPVINAFERSLSSPSTEIPVESAYDTIHAPRKQPCFHKSISDSEVSRFHTPEQHYRRKSAMCGQKIQSSKSPNFKESQKLSVCELFDSCNGQKQGVATEEVSLHQIFRSCNGLRQELPQEACPQRKDSQKSAPTGVHQGEFQKYMEWGKHS
jgi:hypothetical protein